MYTNRGLDTGGVTGWLTVTWAEPVTEPLASDAGASLSDARDQDSSSTAGEPELLAIGRLSKIRGRARRPHWRR